MVQRIVTQLVDDVDGTDLGESDGETVTFALDGQSYEIDLSSMNAEGLRSALQKYISSGRRLGRTAGARTAKRATAVGPSASEVREWARTNGLEVPDRGRIPQEIRDAFDKR